MHHHVEPTLASAPSGPGRPAPSGSAAACLETAERLATIDLAATRHNIASVARRVHPAAVMAVVKANAYGHGALQVAEAALEAGATWLGTAHVSEALALREAGFTAPILAWLHTPGAAFAAAIEAGVDLGVSGWELEPIIEAAAAAGATARVHLKIDTGLGRNGSPAHLWPSLLQRAKVAQDAGHLDVVGIFSHFAVADERERPETQEQLDNFAVALEQVSAAGLTPSVRHIANSPGLLSLPAARFDLVRCGLAMHGLSPFEDAPGSEWDLRPVMRLSTRVAAAKRVPAGQGVSYGLRWNSERETVLGLIPLGYADGIPRVAVDGPVQINGVVYPSIGRVAMDQFVVDLGPSADPEAMVGAEAVLFGGEGEPAVEDWALASGTLNYEIVTRISERVPRRWINTEGEGA